MGTDGASRLRSCLCSCLRTYLETQKRAGAVGLCLLFPFFLPFPLEGGWLEGVQEIQQPPFLTYAERWEQ